jgi:hypothetical protein
MKKMFTWAIVLVLAAVSQVIGNETEESNIPPSLNGMDWKAVENTAWTGYNNDQKTWFKIEKGADGFAILASTDSATWTGHANATWTDKNGSLIRVGQDTVLQVSFNQGYNWSKLDGAAWEDADGNWFMLDRQGILWKMKRETAEEQDYVEQRSQIVAEE